MAAKERPNVPLSSSARQMKLVVYSIPTAQSPEKVVEYLGRYVFRSAITKASTLKLNEITVTFRYKKSGAKIEKGSRVQRGTMQLPIFEFMRCFLQHALPRGVHNVLYYGLLSPANMILCRRLQLILHKPVTDEKLEQDLTELEIDEPTTITITRPCLHCGKGFIHRGSDLRPTTSLFLHQAPPMTQ